MKIRWHKKYHQLPNINWAEVAAMEKRQSEKDELISKEMEFLQMEMGEDDFNKLIETFCVTIMRALSKNQRYFRRNVHYLFQNFEETPEYTYFEEIKKDTQNLGKFAHCPC